MENKIEKIDYTSNLYPERLRVIKDAPKALYCIGDLSLLDSNNIAIVGTRRASPYGRWASYELSKQLSSMGATIVSGLAEGIDTSAHKGALFNDGHTIAVLGTSIDYCFPKSNQNLYDSIGSVGLIVSEYGEGSELKITNFAERNRIIAGLSKCIVAVEFGIKSGTINIVNHGLEYGREIFAVPSNINQPNGVGSNELISDGATPILSLDTEYLNGLFGSILS